MLYLLEHRPESESSWRVRAFILRMYVTSLDSRCDALYVGYKLYDAGGNPAKLTPAFIFRWISTRKSRTAYTSVRGSVQYTGVKSHNKRGKEEKEGGYNEGMEYIVGSYKVDRCTEDITFRCLENSWFIHQRILFIQIFCTQSILFQYLLKRVEDLQNYFNKRR